LSYLVIVLIKTEQSIKQASKQAHDSSNTANT